MLKKLRRKFVALIMVILTVVLTAIFSMVTYMNWQASTADAQAFLTSAIKMAEERQPIGSLNIQERPDGSGFAKPTWDSERDLGPNVLTGVYIEDGKGLTWVQASHGWLEADLLEKVQEEMNGKGAGLGFLDDLGLVYLKVDHEGTTYDAFADASLFTSWKSLGLTFVIIEAVALAFFLIISMAFARWALRPVQLAWDTQRKFVADASHELKTPLSIIMANTDILLGEPDTPAEDRTRWLDSTKQSAEGMRVLIDDMLTLASLDEQMEATAPAPPKEREGQASSTQEKRADLSYITEGCALQFESVSFEQGFTLTEDITPEVYVHADTEDTKRVVQVLLDNACKYVNEGGTVNVSLSATPANSKKGAFAELVVSNSGETIPKDKLSHLFDRFYRTDEARTSGKGHGLGLSIAKALVDQMTGSLEAESEAGMTIFTLRLPLC